MNNLNFTESLKKCAKPKKSAKMQKKSACGECLAYNADSTEAGLWGRLWNRWQG